MSHDDRSIPATERRLLQSRQRGMMPVRRAPVALAGVAGGVLGIAASSGGDSLLAMLERALATGLQPDGTVGARAVVATLVGTVLAVAWPVFLGGLIGAALGTIAQTGGVLSWSRPRGSMGARLLSMSGPGAWGRALSGLAWALAALAAGGAALWGQWATIASLPHLPLARAITEGVGVASVAVLAAFGSLAVLAIVDALHTRVRWHRSLAMSPQEARDEQRATDGDPLVRDRRRRAAREALRALRTAGGPLRQRANELPAPTGDPA